MATNTTLLPLLIPLLLLSFPPLSCGQYEGSPFFNFVSLQQRNNKPLLEYDFYRNVCPRAEQIIRDSMIELYDQDPTTAPQLLRLFFHDCFVGGCDGSVLLDESGNSFDNRTEKVAPPNKTLKGFEKIDFIKSRLEEECPVTVSCADTLALAAREGVNLAGGPCYPLLTGRGDSAQSHFTFTRDLPTPNDKINTILSKFEAKGFTASETVSLLGSHNLGTIGCQFIVNRLTNFAGSGRPDQTLNPDFVKVLRTSCIDPTARLSLGNRFDSHYFDKLLNGTAFLFSDQQLLANNVTASFVMKYAKSDGRALRKNFARAIVKMSVLGTANYQGSVRQTCARLPSSVTGRNTFSVMPN